MGDGGSPPAVVVDNGSGLCKAGFSGDDAPCVTFASVVGRPRHDFVWVGAQLRDTYVGDEAQSRRGVLAMRHPIEHGIITNWNDMEVLWRHTFRELHVTPEEHAVMLTDRPRGPRANPETVTQIMFDTFHVPKMHVAAQAVLSLYACGRNGGVVLDVGDGVTHAVAVYEGYATPHATVRLNVAGGDLTDFLVKLLSERGVTGVDREIVRGVKEVATRVGHDEIHAAHLCNTEPETTYELPDGRVVTLSHERFRCAEPLFRPSLLGVDEPGLPELAVNAVLRMDIELRAQLFGNVVLAGGSTMFEGFADRVAKEMTALAPASARIHVVAPPDRVHSAWVGGSILSSLSTFQERWISREEYDDAGPSIVHRKCFF